MVRDVKSFFLKPLNHWHGIVSLAYIKRSMLMIKYVFMPMTNHHICFSDNLRLDSCNLAFGKQTQNTTNFMLETYLIPKIN